MDEIEEHPWDRELRGQARRLDPYRAVDWENKPAATDASRFPTLCASTLADREVRPREWLVEELIPAKTVTLLNGDGGTGKSLLALQLAVATVTGGLWIGRTVAPGTALYMSAEDDLDELHRRLADIATAAGVTVADLVGLTLAPMAGKDAILAIPEGKGSLLKPTPLLGTIDSSLRKSPVSLVIVDTLADVFGGEENHRAQARQFIGMLRRWAVSFGCTVLVLAHPSLSGMASDSGSSGSTGWNNSVRSRLYFKRVKSADGQEDDPDARVLRTVKANYGRTGSEIPLRWERGVFTPATATGGSFAALAADSKAERIFLELLAKFTEQARYVSHKNGARNWAPTVFAASGKADGLNKRAFAAAMDRLFESGKIEIGKTPNVAPSKAADIIVRVLNGDAE